MKKLIWRLGKLPTPDEVRELVKDKIITKDELESEIVFLRKLVEKLSNGSYSTVKEYIYQYPTPYWGWYQPYVAWCSTSNLVGGSGGNVTLTSTGTSGSNLAYLTNTAGLSDVTTSGYSQTVGSSSFFSDIQTF